MKQKKAVRPRFENNETKNNQTYNKDFAILETNPEATITFDLAEPNNVPDSVPDNNYYVIETQAPEISSRAQQGK